MAGSIVKPPRRVGSTKVLMRTAQTQGNPGGSSGRTSQSQSGSRQEAPGTRRPVTGTPVAQPAQEPRTMAAPAPIKYGAQQGPDMIQAKAPNADYSSWQATQAPQQGTTMIPSRYTTAGSGMARNLNEKRGGDRTGVEVIGAGGTPIRVDRNQEIAGAATREQAQNIRTVDKNSIMYNQYKDPTEIAAQSKDMASKWNALSRAAIDPNATPEQRQKASDDLRALEEDMKYYNQQSTEAAAGLAKEKGVYEPGVGQYRSEVDAAAKQKADEAAAAEAQRVKALSSKQNSDEALIKLDQIMHNYGTPENPNVYKNTDSNLVNRRVNEIGNLLPSMGDGSPASENLKNDIRRMLSELAASSDDNLVNRRYNSVKELLSQLGTMTPNAQPGASGTATAGHGLSSVDGQQPVPQSAQVSSGTVDPVSGLTPERTAATSVPGRDKSGDPRYEQNIGGMTANDVAAVYNIPPDQALFYLNKGVVFDPSGYGMRMPGGQDYSGNEVNDALSAYPSDPENAKDGQAIRSEWSASVAKEADAGRLKAGAEATAATAARVEQELNKPLDLSGLEKGFERQLDAQRQTAARNKALALRGIQERGAYSGASVNQMMGSSTEAGYGYDTEAQAQEAALNLQKEMEKVKATKEDASRKLNWAVMLYNNAKTDEDKAKYWSIKQQQDEVLRQQQIYEANLAAQANSPSLGMTLAKVGIGVGGAVLAPFTGGSSLLVAGALGAGLQGAESAGMFGGGANAYSAYNQANQNQPGAPAPGANSFTYGTGYAPGSRLNLGVPQLQLGAG